MMIQNNNAILSNWFQDIFPDQVQMYKIDSWDRFESGTKPTLLHKHFKEPPSKETWEQLAHEIAGFLTDQSIQTVYSFFYRNVSAACSDPDWILCSARLNKFDNGGGREIVFFMYDLQFLDNRKTRLYRVLENDGFFRDHLPKVALLTKREKEIIGLVASGMTSKEIAAAFFVSVHTVNTHRKRITEKLGTKCFSDLMKFSEIFDLRQC
jgi:DNA-binding CsgD family transcriptional regulator